MTSPIFSKDFYSNFHEIEMANPLYRLQNGTITVAKRKNTTFLQKIRTLFFVDTNLFAVGNRLSEIEDRCRKGTYDEFLTELHRSGCKGVNRLKHNIYTLHETIAQQSSRRPFTKVVLRIRNILRKILRKPPLPLKESHLTHDMTPYTRIMKEALSLIDDEKKHCHFTIEVVQGDRQNLYNEKLQKLECGLREKPINVKSGKQLFQLRYDKFTQAFSCSFRGPEVDECFQACLAWKPKFFFWRTPRPILKKYDARVCEDERVFILKCKTSATFNRSGFIYTSPYSKHALQLKPDRLYTLGNKDTDHPLQFYIRRRAAKQEE